MTISKRDKLGLKEFRVHLYDIISNGERVILFANQNYKVIYTWNQSLILQVWKESQYGVGWDELEGRTLQDVPANWEEAQKACMKLHADLYPSLTPERAQELIQAAYDKASVGPWVDQLDKVMTKDEVAAVKEVWDTMPGDTNFVDAMYRIARANNPTWVFKTK